MDEQSIFVVGNPYGYKLNMSHPRIKELCARYMAWKDIPNRPLTDAERREFEKMVIEKERKG